MTGSRSVEEPGHGAARPDLVRPVGQHNAPDSETRSTSAASSRRLVGSAHCRSSTSSTRPSAMAVGDPDAGLHDRARRVSAATVVAARGQVGQHATPGRCAAGRAGRRPPRCRSRPARRAGRAPGSTARPDRTRRRGRTSPARPGRSRRATATCPFPDRPATTDHPGTVRRTRRDPPDRRDVSAPADETQRARRRRSAIPAAGCGRGPAPLAAAGSADRPPPGTGRARAHRPATAGRRRSGPAPRPGRRPPPGPGPGSARRPRAAARPGPRRGAHSTASVGWPATSARSAARSQAACRARSDLVPERLGPAWRTGPRPAARRRRRRRAAR